MALDGRKRRLAHDLDRNAGTPERTGARLEWEPAAHDAKGDPAPVADELVLRLREVRARDHERRVVRTALELA